MALIRHNIINAMITNATYDEVLVEITHMLSHGHTGYVCLSNVHMVVEGILNKQFQSIINAAELALPDGKPIGILMNLLYGTSQKRIAGPELMLDVLRYAEVDGSSVFLYGSTPDILDAMQKKLAMDMPCLKIAGMISPPFRPLSQSEDADSTRQIIDSGAKIVLVSLGCPKQERWMAEHIHRIPSIMIGVGAGFPFYTGHVSRAPEWMQSYCLEWLYRIYAEPRRLIKRYVITNSIFLTLGFFQLLLNCLMKPYRLLQRS